MRIPFMDLLPACADLKGCAGARRALCTGSMAGGPGTLPGQRAGVVLNFHLLVSLVCFSVESKNAA